LGNNLKVSVVLPTYNRARLLKRSIASVLEQTYRNLELIVVDDCSVDDTMNVVRSFDDKRIRYIRHKNNRGEAASRNTGIKLAEGKYIASQDSDDEWVREKLEKQMKVFENSPSNLGVVYSGLWKIKGDKKNYIPSGGIKKKEGHVHNELLKVNFIGTPTTVIKKECFEKVGFFDERLFHLVDWELWIRISKHYDFKYISEALTLVHFTKGSISSSKDALVDARELIFKKHFLEIKEDKKLLAYHAYILGSEFHKRKDRDRGKQYISQAFLVCPFRIKFLLAFLMSRFAPFGFKFFYELKKIITLKFNMENG